MQHIKNIFCKSSHLTILKKADLPDGGLRHPITVNLLTFQPQQTNTVTLTKGGDSVDMTGTYGLNPWDIFNPFKERTNLMWMLMYQQGLLKDVNAEIITQNGSFTVAVNNPTIGQPYIVFYSSVVIAAALPLAGTRFNLGENESAIWTSDSGAVVNVFRNMDSDNKEFVIVV